MAVTNLSSRSLAILKALVEQYIRDGQPIGSKSLAREAQLMISSATIRHIMADLEQMGYLTSPHTSAGRMPTTSGYRLFVDHFISLQKPGLALIQQMQQNLGGDADAKALVVKASHLLSSMTHLTGLVTLPRQPRLLLQQVEFLPLSKDRVLVVLVLNEHEVQNRVIQTKKTFSRATLEQAGQFITAQFKGKDLLNIRQSLLDELKRDRQDLDRMLQSVMDIAEATHNEYKAQAVVIDGESNLLGEVDNDNVAGLKYIFDAFTQKNDLLHLLDQCMQAKGIKIFIGKETGQDILDQYSLVTAPYSANGEIAGVLGVIGPRRMAYQTVIATVDLTAKVLSSAFNLSSEEY